MAITLQITPQPPLPTSGTARFFSPLGVDDFVMQKSSFIYYTRDAGTPLRPAKASCRLCRARGSAPTPAA